MTPSSITQLAAEETLAQLQQPHRAAQTFRDPQLHRELSEMKDAAAALLYDAPQRPAPLQSKPLNQK